MQTFRLLVITTLIVLLPVSVLAQQPEQGSIAQLRTEIQKLSAIERDETLSTEVRELNRVFLNKRRIQLQSLLKKQVEELRNYLSTVGSSLTADEKLIVQNTIADAEKDLRSLVEDRTSRPNADSQTPPSVGANQIIHSGSVSPAIAGDNGNGNGNGSNSSTVSATPVSSANLTAVNTPQTQLGPSLNATLNARIRSKVRVEQTDNTNQTDSPSISGSSASLVDQSSASDLIGLATNLAGLSASSNDNQTETSSVAVTASAYSLLAAIKRVDPLNPVFYDQHRNWRKFSITLGYDDEDQPDGTKQRAKLFGAKFMFIDRRDPGLARNQAYVDAVGKSLERAAFAFGNLSARVRGHVLSLDVVRRTLIAPGFKDFLDRKRPQVELDLERARNRLPTAAAAEAPAIQAQIARMEETLQRIDRLLQNPGDSALFVLGSNSLPTPDWTREELEYQIQFINEFLGPDYRTKLGEEIANQVDAFVDQQLTDAELVAFRNLDASAREAVENIRRAPQFSLAFTTKQRRIGIDEYLGTLIFDYGVADRINLTLNGSYSYNDSAVIGGDLRGFKFGGQLRFQLNRENLLGKKPLFFDVSTQGNWMNNTDAVYKAQGKLTIPIADGMDFPISVTWANRTNLIDEKEVRGQFGFTLDTARLIRMFLFR